VVKLVGSQDNAKPYTRVHVSFQSTSSCNLSTVNAVNRVSNCVKKKERGRGAAKRLWGIEMNDARHLYLKTYGRIDSIDHMIKNCGLFYRSWKYWHAAMLHAKGLAIVIAYDVYKECAEGNLNPLWKIDKPVDFWTFREKLSRGLLQYSPKGHVYPGDSKMRVATKQHASNRSKGSTPSSHGSNSPTGVERLDNISYEQLLDASLTNTQQKARLCGDLNLLTKHFASMVTGIRTVLSVAFQLQLSVVFAKWRFIHQHQIMPQKTILQKTPIALLIITTPCSLDLPNVIVSCRLNQTLPNERQIIPTQMLGRRKHSLFTSNDSKRSKRKQISQCKRLQPTITGAMVGSFYMIIVSKF
jgi:hypothetical protein